MDCIYEVGTFKRVTQVPGGLFVGGGGGGTRQNLGRDTRPIFLVLEFSKILLAGGILGVVRVFVIFLGCAKFPPFFFGGGLTKFELLFWVIQFLYLKTVS